MNYDLRLAGYKENLRVDNADELRNRWEQFIRKEIPDEVVSIRGWTGKLSDIKAFREAPAIRSENNAIPEEIEENYRKGLRQFRNLSLEQKSENLEFFRLQFWGFTLKKSEDFPEIEKQAIEIQTKFFQENPRRMFPDPILFKSVLKDFKDSCHPNILLFLERHISQDRFAERFI